jgi:peptidoglycan/xylan/chitin deacetylase (PgdA/CDA1 family)
VRLALLIAPTLTFVLLAASEGSAAPPYPRWPTPALGPSTSGDPEVLFTFDDGPQPGTSDRILDTLDRYGVRAVFFMVGRHLRGARLPSGQRIVDRMLAAGHLPANHTVDHVHLCQGSRAEAEWQIDENRRIVESATRLPAVLFRAPYGNRCKRLESQLGERAIAHMHWDIDPQEWKYHDAAYTRGYVIRKLAKLEGRAVILLHDIHAATAAALPGVLDWILAENARRLDRGERAIRILEPADVALEELAPGTLPLLGEMLTAARGFGPDLIRSVVRPLERPPEQHAARL